MIINLMLKPFIHYLNILGSLVERNPILDIKQFPWVESVEQHTKEICKELEAVMNGKVESMLELSGSQNSLTKDNDWKTFFLFIYGEEVQANTIRCPCTKEALLNIPDLKTAFFSILPPETSIASHKGPYNGVLRYHLGLKVPTDKNNCGIRVKNEMATWKVGKSLVFDDSYEHEAWNKTTEDRVVLFLDFTRPSSSFVKKINDWYYRRIITQRRQKAFKDRVFNLT